MLNDIWENKITKEFLLLIITTVAAQLVLGLGELNASIETAKSWGDVITSGTAWAQAFSFSAGLTVLRQAIAWAIAKLAGSQL